MKTPAMKIRNLIKLGLNQKTISEKTGIPPSTINKILKGVTKNPNWEAAEKLNKLYQTTVSQ